MFHLGIAFVNDERVISLLLVGAHCAVREARMFWFVRRAPMAGQNVNGTGDAVCDPGLGAEGTRLVVDLEHLQPLDHELLE